MISFNVTKAESGVIRKIVDRAEIVAHDLDADVPDRMSLTMDITACHANGNPLKLDELLAADRTNFVHDVWGIMRHIDRDTGKLLDFFSPRYSAKVPA